MIGKIESKMDKFFGIGKKWKTLDFIKIPQIIVAPIFSPKHVNKEES